MIHRLLLVLSFVAFTVPISVNAQAPRYARVISQNANLRNTPSINSASQEEIAEGTVVKVLDDKLPWYVVRFGNLVGWMHGNTLEFINREGSISDTPIQPSTSSDTRPSPHPISTRDSSPEIINSRPRPPARTSRSDRTYITGPRGGCYYISGSGRKVYVDRSLCN